MTVRQHAPRLEQVHPTTLEASRRLLSTLAAIAVVALAIVAALVLGPEATVTQGEPYPFVEQMNELRQMIPRGSI